MIKINGNKVEVGHFPDGTESLRMIESFYKETVEIDWLYDKDEELITLIYLVEHLHSIGHSSISLFMPYVPNARNDRTEKINDIFTLKYFANMINGLEFDLVEILDPHSHVSEALLNNVLVHHSGAYIDSALDRITKEGGMPLFFYPDNGAEKKYSKVFKFPYTFGIKKRDWETGKIQGLDIYGEVDKIKDNDILIIDDICSRGGTFLHSAKKLKELGANDIYLYVSHCENTIIEGDLINSGLIKKIFTTDSIFTKEHELIEIIERFRD